MGWTEEEVLYCDINALRVAHRGRVDMFQAIFGKSGPSEPQPPTGGGGKVVKLTPRVFDQMFPGKHPDPKAA